MMHEFRLPSNITTNANLAHAKNDNDVSLEAEIWTLCRIFKRNVSQRKQQMAEVKPLAYKSARMSSNMEFMLNQQTYINFGPSHEDHHNQDKPVLPVNSYTSSGQRNQFYMSQLTSSDAQQPQQILIPSSNFWIQQAANELLSFDNWDELGSVVKFAVDSPSL
ncbi:hypothetical protein KIW84_010209 [Lathyrus oleraceus]|nr:hypothetical protein KIW84_010209 [Pisum sativum]